MESEEEMLLKESKYKKFKGKKNQLMTSANTATAAMQNEMENFTNNFESLPFNDSLLHNEIGSKIYLKVKLHMQNILQKSRDVFKLARVKLPVESPDLELETALGVRLKQKKQQKLKGTREPGLMGMKLMMNECMANIAVIEAQIENFTRRPKGHARKRMGYLTDDTVVDKSEGSISTAVKDFFQKSQRQNVESLQDYFNYCLKTIDRMDNELERFDRSKTKMQHSSTSDHQNDGQNGKLEDIRTDLKEEKLAFRKFLIENKARLEQCADMKPSELRKMFSDLRNQMVGNRMPGFQIEVEENGKRKKLEKEVEQVQTEKKPLQHSAADDFTQDISNLRYESDGLKKQLQKLRQMMVATLDEQDHTCGQEGTAEMMAADYVKLKKDLLKEKERNEKLMMNIQDLKEQNKKLISQLQDSLSVTTTGVHRPSKQKSLDSRRKKAAAVSPRHKGKVKDSEAQVEEKSMHVEDLDLVRENCGKSNASSSSSDDDVKPVVDDKSQARCAVLQQEIRQAPLEIEQPQLKTAQSPLELEDLEFEIPPVQQKKSKSFVCNEQPTNTEGKSKVEEFVKPYASSNSKKMSMEHLPAGDKIKADGLDTTGPQNGSHGSPPGCISTQITPCRSYSQSSVKSGADGNQPSPGGSFSMLVRCGTSASVNIDATKKKSSEHLPVADGHKFKGDGLDTKKGVIYPSGFDSPAPTAMQRSKIGSPDSQNSMLVPQATKPRASSGRPEWFEVLTMNTPQNGSTSNLLATENKDLDFNSPSPKKPMNSRRMGINPFESNFSWFQDPTKRQGKALASSSNSQFGSSESRQHLPVADGYKFKGDVLDAKKRVICPAGFDSPAPTAMQRSKIGSRDRQNSVFDPQMTKPTASSGRPEWFEALTMKTPQNGSTSNLLATEEKDFDFDSPSPKKPMNSRRMGINPFESNLNWFQDPTKRQGKALASSSNSQFGSPESCQHLPVADGYKFKGDGLDAKKGVDRPSGFDSPTPSTMQRSKIGSPDGQSSVFDPQETKPRSSGGQPEWFEALSMKTPQNGCSNNLVGSRDKDFGFDSPSPKKPMNGRHTGINPFENNLSWFQDPTKRQGKAPTSSSYS